MTMQSAIILAAENKKLRAANEKIKKKRQKKKLYVGKGGVFNAKEVQEAQKRVVKEEEVGNLVVKQVGQFSRSRAPLTCSICKFLNHTARTCAERR
jgi:hypothetical protein